jgi:predicted Rossmann fold nucleotide-binding protein DprA/Smf involved in DNA uptake
MVGVVPGPANSATSAGCHDLIQRLGVKLVTSAQDVDWLR